MTGIDLAKRRTILAAVAAASLPACGSGESDTAGQGAASAPAGPTSPPPASAGTYVTDFSLAENPISENGAWRRAHNPWTNVRTINGVAFGTNGVTNTYDDSYALLTGAFGADQTMEGVVFRDPNLTPGPTHEIEFRLRSSDDANSVRGYECLFNWFGGVQIFRWNGPWDDVVPVAMSEARSLGRPLATGDVVKAGIVGNVITMHINGVLVGKATDSTFATGNPGIAFFIRPGGSNLLLGLTRVAVTSSS